MQNNMRTATCGTINSPGIRAGNCAGASSIQLDNGEHFCVSFQDANNNEIIPTPTTRSSILESVIVFFEDAPSEKFEFDQFNCLITFDDADELVQLGCDESFNFSLDCEDGTASFFSDLAPNGANDRKRQEVMAVPVSNLLQAASGASGDPHLTGGNNQRFDFLGQDGGVYNLFSADHIQANMRLASNGPADHFIVEIGIVVDGKTMSFNTMAQRNRKAYLAGLQKVVSPFGGSVKSLNDNMIQVTVCGLSFTVQQRKTWHAVLKGRKFAYLDIEIVAPDCPPEDVVYGGILGPTYHCDADEEFAFDNATEEQYRVERVSAHGELIKQRVCKPEMALDLAHKKLTDGLSMIVDRAVKSPWMRALAYINANNATHAAQPVSLDHRQKFAQLERDMPNVSAQKSLSVLQKML